MSESFVDDDFIQKLIEQYSDMLLRVSYQYVRNKQDAEDVTQEVFLELLNYLHRAHFQSSEHMKAWLIRVAINKSINLAKYNAKHRTKGISDLIFSEYAEPQFDDLEAVLSQLSAINREVVYLHYFEGYSAKEIARIFNKTEKSIFKRIQRSRNMLKDYISEGGI